MKNLRFHQFILLVFRQLTLVCLILCNGKVFSQEESQNVLKKKYDLAVDYLNCSLAKTSLKSLPSFDAKCKCECNFREIDSYQNFYKYFFENLNCGPYDKTLDLLKEIEDLKKKDVESEDDGIIFLTHGVFFAAIKKENSFLKDFLQRRDIKSVNDSLKLTELLTSSLITSGVIHIFQSGNIKFDREPEPVWIGGEDEGRQKLDFVIVGLLTIIITLVLLIGFILFRNKILNIFATKNPLVENPEFNSIMNENFSPNVVLEKKSDLVISNNETKSNNIDNTNFVDIANDSEVNEEPAPPLPSYHSIYFANPNSDGSFNAASGKVSYVPGGSLYEFTVEGNNLARFRITNHSEAHQIALAYPDRCIAPVCEELNVWSSTSRVILTEVAGEAILNEAEQKWIVKTKAKIRYQ